MYGIYCNAFSMDGPTGEELSALDYPSRVKHHCAYVDGHFGGSVADADDVNGDGISDVTVGAPHESEL